MVVKKTWSFWFGAECKVGHASRDAGVGRRRTDAASWPGDRVEKEAKSEKNSRCAPTQKSDRAKGCAVEGGGEAHEMGEALSASDPSSLPKPAKRSRRGDLSGLTPAERPNVNIEDCQYSCARRRRSRRVETQSMPSIVHCCRVLPPSAAHTLTCHALC